MKNHLVPFLPFLTLLTSLQPIAAYSDIIIQKAEEVEEKVIAWLHDIHQHPELSNREVCTAALIAKHLKSLGIEVKTGIGVTRVVGAKS